MQENSEVTQFGSILIFIIGALLFCLGILFVGKLLRPHRPNEEKLTTYESGEDAVGNAWALFNPRFYIIALIFVLFEVEIIFLIPWATVFGHKKLIDQTQGAWGWYSLAEMLIFIGLLVIGLCYVWSRGFLDWDKSQQENKKFQSPVPEELYDRVNKKYEKIIQKKS